MKYILTFLAAFFALGLTTAHAEDAKGPNNKTEYTTKDNGGYKVESKSKLTTEAGTDKSGSRTVDVDIDDDGSISKTVKSESVSDPEGLMNKVTSEAKTKIKEDEDGDTMMKETSDKTDADGTNVKTKTESDTKVDANGNIRATVETKKIVDPKGLLNKEETTTTTKTVNGRIVEQEKDHD